MSEMEEALALRGGGRTYLKVLRCVLSHKKYKTIENL